MVKITSKKLETIRDKLQDNRSGKIIFLSHCLLNENTRYFGGAFEESFNKDCINQIHTKGYGIIQMPCPEQIAWGGVLKPYLWLGIDLKKTPLYPFRHLLFKTFIWHTKRKYSRIAKNIIRQIEEYMKSGYKVMGIVGVGGSPTCGITEKIGLESYEKLTEISVNTITRQSWNELLYSELLKNGKGLFMQILNKKLEKRNIKLNFYEFSLVSEMDSKQQDIFEKSKE